MEVGPEVCLQQCMHWLHLSGLHQVSDLYTLRHVNSHYSSPPTCMYGAMILISLSHRNFSQCTCTNDLNQIQRGWWVHNPLPTHIMHGAMAFQYLLYVLAGSVQTPACTWRGTRSAGSSTLYQSLTCSYVALENAWPWYDHLLHVARSTNAQWLS